MTRRYTLALLLAAFPLAVAIGSSPWSAPVAMAAFLFLAYRSRVHWHFLAIVLGAFLLNLCVVTSFAIYSDADNFFAPAIRLLAATHEFTPDGAFSQTHLGLSTGFLGWSANLYALTGWVDAGNCLVFLLLPAAWIAVRASLSRWQSALLIVAPLTFVSVYCTMPDGAMYLLLLTAVFALRQKSFWLPLLAALTAMTLKSWAWIPGGLVLLVLMRDHPRRIWKLLAVSVAIGLYFLLPSLLVDPASAGSDFLGADASAQQMGYFARQAYAYLGHWCVPGSPQFNIAVGGIDGGGIDGLGPLFRILVWLSLATLLVRRKKFAGWGETLALMWASVLMIPTLYIGYARYVPLIYPAVMLPLVLTFPRTLATIGCLAVNAMPAAWLAWRLVLSFENLYALQHATAVQSDTYNVRCEYRGRLVSEPQPYTHKTFFYTYALPEGTQPFPMQRPAYAGELRLQPAQEKARGVMTQVLTQTLPWCLRQTPTYIYEVLTYRVRHLCDRHGDHDDPAYPRNER